MSNRSVVIRRARRTVLSVVAVAAAGVLAATSGVAAQAVPDDQRVQADVVETYTNEASGLRIEDTIAEGVRSSGRPLSNNQRWNVHEWNDGTVQLKNVATGRCLSHMGDLTWATGTTCFAGSDPRSVQQSWFVTHWADGTIRFRNQNSNQCLDGFSFGEISMEPCNTSESQSWY